MPVLSRRGVLAAGALPFLPLSALAATPRGLAFAVFRNGTRVGEHVMSFRGEAASALAVTTEVEMTVRVGPVPLYRYRHHAVERWAGDQFASLETTTTANGKAQRVVARRTPGGVKLETGKGVKTIAASAAPFTHWNAAVLTGPLFNPQEGTPMRLTATRKGAESVRLASGTAVPATRWAIRGEAEIDDWYDASGVWAALRGKLKDGSVMEYRRL